MSGQRLTLTDGISAVTGNFSGNVTGSTQVLSGQLTGQRVSLNNGIAAVTGNFSGVVTASAFVGDGSLLTNINFGGGSGTVPVTSGGTGLSSGPSNGQLLIGNSGAYTKAQLTSGTGIAITNGAGTITIEHEDTSTANSFTLANGNVVNGITIDGNGHITGYASKDLDTRYYKSFCRIS